MQMGERNLGNLNKDIKKIDLTQGSTIITEEDVFKVRRRVIEEDETGRTIMVVVLQDAESYRIEEKEIQEATKMERKMQNIDKEFLQQELDRIRKENEDPNFTPPDLDG